MDMVEKVGRACAKAARAPDEAWRAYTHIARAAIEAMREPTHSMLSRGAAMTDDPESMNEARAHGVWWSMIDQALSDQPRADPGIPIHPTSLVEKGIPGLATIHDATDDVLGKDGE